MVKGHIGFLLFLVSIDIHWQYLAWFVCVRIGNTFELCTRNANTKTISLAAESLEDRQTWLVKLARVSTTSTATHHTVLLLVHCVPKKTSPTFLTVT